MFTSPVDSDGPILFSSSSQATAKEANAKAAKGRDRSVDETFFWEI